MTSYTFAFTAVLNFLLLIKFRIYKTHYIMDPPLRNDVEFYLSLLVMRGIVVALLALLDALLDEVEIRCSVPFHGLSFAFNDLTIAH